MTARTRLPTQLVTTFRYKDGGGGGDAPVLFFMTRKEHREFRDKANKALSAIADHVFNRAPLITEEKEKHIDTLCKLETEYNQAINALDQIESKLYHYFK